MDQDFYFNFEKKFRGNREEIIERISIYDPLVELLIKQSKDHKFLDIGCGRGEWLQKWHQKISSSLGIEVDSNMANYCLNKGYQVIHDDAINSLKNISDESVTLITIFHMIEHLDNNYLNKLITSCYRILDKNGILIIETPSIDNLSVSTKSFYLDPTHVNHINPDGFSFLIDQKGFSKSKYFYINGGPLNSASPLKITKILNGVAQDVAFIATKSEKTSKLIFEEETDWQLDFNKCFSTLDAAIAYDIENEKQSNQLETKYLKVSQDLNLVKSELLLLRNDLKYLIIAVKILKKLLFPLLYIVRFSIKKTLYYLNKLFILILRFKLARKIFESGFFLNIVDLVLNKITGDSSHSIIIKIKNNIEKFKKNDSRSDKFNNMLRVHYRNSKMSNVYFNFLKSGKIRTKE